jgi:hypothetical protein
MIAATKFLLVVAAARARSLVPAPVADSGLRVVATQRLALVVARASPLARL